MGLVDVSPEIKPVVSYCIIFPSSTFAKFYLSMIVYICMYIPYIRLLASLLGPELCNCVPYLPVINLFLPSINSPLPQILKNNFLNLFLRLPLFFLYVRTTGVCLI